MFDISIIIYVLMHQTTSCMKKKRVLNIIQLVLENFLQLDFRELFFFVEEYCKFQ